MPANIDDCGCTPSGAAAAIGKQDDDQHHAQAEAHAAAHGILGGLGHGRDGNAHNQRPQHHDKPLRIFSAEIEVLEINLERAKRNVGQHRPHNSHDSQSQQLVGLLTLLIPGIVGRGSSHLWSAARRQALRALSGLQIVSALDAKDRLGREGVVALRAGLPAATASATHHFAQRYPFVHPIVPCTVGG